jgi:probable F420-dependent oxidoreductase
MKFALRIPIGDITPGEFQSNSAIAEMVGALESAGVDGCHLTDHPAPSAEWLLADGHDALDPFTALAFVAAHSSRVKLITDVVVLPYRNPFLTAKAAATLQVLSGGRFILGTGGGYQQVEFEALGADYERRGELFDEAVETMRHAWSGEIVVRKGVHFDATGNLPRPVPDPPPPIWIGGSGDNAVKRAARCGDGWCPFFARPGQSKINHDLAVRSREQLAEKIATLQALRASHGNAGPFDIAIGPPKGPEQGSRASVDEYLDEVQEFERIGVTWVTVRPPSPNRQVYVDYVRWFGDAVIARSKAPAA